MDDAFQYSESLHESEDHGSFQNQASTPQHGTSLHGVCWQLQTKVWIHPYNKWTSWWMK